MKPASRIIPISRRAIPRPSGCHAWLSTLTLSPPVNNAYKARARQEGHLVESSASPPHPLRYHSGYLPRAPAIWGIRSQRYRITVLFSLSLDTTENCAYAIQHRNELALYLAEEARARIPIDFSNYLSEVEEGICKMATEEMRTRPQTRRIDARPTAPRANDNDRPLKRKNDVREGQCRRKAGGYKPDRETPKGGRWRKQTSRLTNGYLGLSYRTSQKWTKWDNVYSQLPLLI